jgi:hypothetical protein
MRLWHSGLICLLTGVVAAQAPVQGGRPGPVVTPPVVTPPVTAPAEKPKAQEPAKPQTSPPLKPVAVPTVEPKPADGKPPVKPTVPAKPEVEVADDEVIPVPNQLPKSADPADIAAMQGAQAMLKAEARLRKMLKAGEIKGIDKILTFEEISSWPYQDGLKGCPESVKKMDGKTVLMTGFMLPIDEVENIKEFLLVQSLWSCCYGQPPDINGIVRVVMKGNKRLNYKYDPIKITGQFKVVASYEDGYCIDIFQLQADEVDVIK